MANRQGTQRVQIQLSGYHDKLSQVWAKSHGRRKTTLLGQALSDVIESKASEIMQSVSRAARLEGVTEEEILDRWLEDEEEGD